ncbi:MAG TPA: hypothetical protein VH396_04700 [Chitinophagaceae bacterium]
MNQHKLKKREEQMLIVFSRLGSLYYLSFTGQEILRDKILGLDGPRRKILIIQDHDHRYEFKLIDLCEVTDCKLKKTYGAMNGGELNKNELGKYLNKIALEFYLKNESQPIALEFYNGVTDSLYEMAELENRAKRWEAMLSKMLPYQQPKIA